MANEGVQATANSLRSSVTPAARPLCANNSKIRSRGYFTKEGREE
jgi:hypothetical protein